MHITQTSHTLSRVMTAVVPENSQSTLDFRSTLSTSMKLFYIALEMLLLDYPVRYCTRMMGRCCFT